MGIVVLTIPGDSKREFVNSLNEMTGGKIDLVIIQKPKEHSFLKNLKRLRRSVGNKRFIKELWHATLLRFDSNANRTLSYFRERSGLPRPKVIYPLKIIEVTSVNSLPVFEMLKELSPDLMVIWGSGIIKPSIIKTAKKAINLHMGLCPYYRGALANQNAVLHRNIRRIGATIHYAEAKVDTGDIITTITVDESKPPKELFRELNDRAERTYLKVASELYAGKQLPRTRQNQSRSKNLLLKEWLPTKRYKLAKQIKQWEKTGKM